MQKNYFNLFWDCNKNSSRLVDSAILPNILIVDSKGSSSIEQFEQQKAWPNAA